MPFDRMKAARERYAGNGFLSPVGILSAEEAGSSSHVSWHQDLTYWGLDGGAQVSMWLALSPATAESGCMRQTKHDLDSAMLVRGEEG